MFSVLSYGRLVARAVLGGLSQTDPRAGGGGGGGGDYGLVTAGCGFGKDFRKGLLKKGACYGDDACFVARHRSADVLGSSTACIVVLDRTSHRLHTANLGDSGFLVVRGGEVVHRSDEQQHYFNTPFQLSIAPPEAEGVVLSDSPDAADSTSFDVQLGDIILTATDGLFDNMPDYMILQELKKLKNSNYESIQQTARSIAEQAHELAYDPNYMSPFAQFACDNGLNVRGGKPDDITVLLSIVAEYTD
ncbi:hypothetical protein FD755_018375 [Muntiacus reevesi]|uniref:Protein phosphatase n=1 Tax=Muntiacus reevesi TaxID=9886 RepID=A0A5N3X8M4_MUNRE|nr:hypothetical protein FD755_018375 [Muntiacus reevesi]